MRYRRTLHLICITSPEGGVTVQGARGALKGTFLRAQVYARVGIILVEVSERVGKYVIFSLQKGPKGLTYEFYDIKKSRKRSGFVLDSY